MTAAIFNTYDPLSASLDVSHVTAIIEPLGTWIGWWSGPIVTLPTGLSSLVFKFWLFWLIWPSVQLIICNQAVMALSKVVLCCHLWTVLPVTRLMPMSSVDSSCLVIMLCSSHKFFLTHLSHFTLGLLTFLRLDIMSLLCGNILGITGKYFHELLTVFVWKFNWQNTLLSPTHTWGLLYFTG